ncbi:MAG TPA: hypothetical protein VGM75_36680 [Pseudonocardiaceae bacterium]
MGTRSDFYVGTGTDAEWIGSLQFGCHPDALLKDWYGHAALTARTHNAYREAVDQLLFTWAVNGLGAAHRARYGWPWPWNTSHCNDWVLTFADSIEDSADGGKPADTDADTARETGVATGSAAARGIYLTAGGGSIWHYLDPEDPRPPLRCGPPNFAQWLSNPAAPPAVALPVHDGAASPGSDISHHWWRCPFAVSQASDQARPGL